MQLITPWKDDTLAKSALLPIDGNPRRAIENEGQILAVSDSSIASFPVPKGPSDAK